MLSNKMLLTALVKDCNLITY